MDYENFKEKFMEDVKEAVEESTGRGVEVSTNTFDKVNESYDAMTITPEGSNVGVNLNIQMFYDAYNDGMNYDDVIAKASRVAEQGINTMPAIDASELADYEQLKDKLVMQVVSAEKNAELLESIPHKEMEDMAIVYRFEVMADDDGGVGTILVTNRMLDKYDVSAEQLHEDAMQSSPLVRPVEIKGMSEVMRDMMGEEFTELFPADVVDEKMYVATVPSKTQGAGVIAYQDFMDQAAERLGGDFFVIPSSVHEVLLVRDEGDMDARSLQAMVVEVNATQVAPGDRLTDSVYHYDSREHIFELADKFEARVQAIENISSEKEEKGSVLQDLAEKQREIKEKDVSKDVADKASKKDKGEVSL